MAKLMYPGANRSIRYRDPDAKGDLEQYVNRKEKGDQPQRANRAGKGDQPQRVNRAGKGDQPQRVNRNLKGNFFGGFGDERTGIRKPITRMPMPAPAAPVPKPKSKPPQVIRTTVSERMSPVKAAAPTRMAVNRATGDTTGFTTGTRTGSTATKAGVAGKTRMSASQRTSQNAFNKGGVAGPRKDSSGRNVSSASGKRK